MSPSLDARPTHPIAVSLAALAQDLGLDLHGDDVAGATCVSGITLSNLAVRPGDLFVALAGQHRHGAEFAAAAVTAGAAAVLTDPAGARVLASAALGAPILVVLDPRASLGRLSAAIYGFPAREVAMLGVTGTQGKTTTTRLISGLVDVLGTAQAGTSAVIGTVGTQIGPQRIASALTTPEAPELHGLIAVMREHAVQTCAMEVSSHALVMGRVAGVEFTASAFLNLGRDHLDFHPDLEDYFAAKARLFEPGVSQRAVINADDDYGQRLLQSVAIPAVSFGLRREADWRAVDLKADSRGTTFALLRGTESYGRGRVQLPGSFNVSNAVAAIALLAEAGLDPRQVLAALDAVPGAPGRLERVEEGQPFAVLVDYAHKPDALDAVLRALGPQASEGRLIVVVGAGGDRDQGKRPLMGRLCSELADVVLITDDNPRSEDPARIRAAILSGATGTATVREVADRAAAIDAAIALADKGDVVVIAGKGHETGQQFADRTEPFDDRVVAREALARHRSRWASTEGEG